MWQRNSGPSLIWMPKSPLLVSWKILDMSHLTGSGSQVETWPNCLQVNLECYVYKSQLWWSTTTCFLVQFSISIVHSIFVFAGWTNIKFPATEGTLMTTYWLVICNMMVILVLTARKGFRLWVLPQTSCDMWDGHPHIHIHDLRVSWNWGSPWLSVPLFHFPSRASLQWRFHLSWMTTVFLS